MKFFWGMLLGGFLGSIGTMWYVQKQMQSVSAQPTSTEQVSNTISSDFLDFYEDFHSDSIYQIDHVVFPLQGLPAYADSLTILNNDYRFEKKDWVIHQKFEDQNGNFQRTFKNLGDGFVVEQIEDKTNDIGMQRRFAKTGGEWFLIYYAEINFIGG